MEAFFEDFFQFESQEDVVKKRYLIVVIYDISDNKRRLKVSKILNGYGKRVQKSAYECILDRSKYDELIAKLNKKIVGNDLLRVYKTTGSADVKIWGDVSITNFDDIIII